MLNNKISFDIILFMSNIILVDEKIDSIYTGYLESLNYKIVKIIRNEVVYDEISSHTDIFCVKIKNNLIVEPNIYEYLKKNNVSNLIKGTSTLKSKYPQDIKYNLCVIGNYAVHNFNYTDEVVLEYTNKYGLKKVHVNQGYTNCSIAVIDEKSCITSNVEIYEKLSKVGLDVLLISEESEKNIKLIAGNGKFSKMHGFIGGALCKLNNKCILFGDKTYLEEYQKIEDFIIKKGYQFVDFKNKEIIDYGGIIEV